MGHFCRTASMMLKAGLQLPEILEVTIHAVSTNQVVNQALTEVREKLMEGQGLSHPMAENKLFPPTMVKMIAMGEQTGNIDTALTTLATYYEEKANQSIQALIATIEPVLTVLMGLGVAFIMVAILLPMYSVLRSIH
jgi:type IV pilus assembly protein PilC